MGCCPASLVDTHSGQSDVVAAASRLFGLPYQRPTQLDELELGQCQHSLRCLGTPRRHPYPRGLCVKSVYVHSKPVMSWCAWQSWRGGGADTCAGNSLPDRHRGQRRSRLRSQALANGSNWGANGTHNHSLVVGARGELPQMQATRGTCNGVKLGLARACSVCQLVKLPAVWHMLRHVVQLEQTLWFYD